MTRLRWIALLALLGVAPVFAQGPVTPAAVVTSTVYDGTTPLLPRYSKVDAAINGDNHVIVGVAGSKIRVLAGVLTMTGTSITIRFEDTGGGTALTGQMQPTQGETIVFPFSPVGWFETSAGNALNLELGGAQSVDGVLVYVLVP